MPGVTIYDVARVARVSPATVSRVLNHSTLVRDQTRQRVWETIERLGYEPPNLGSPRGRAARVSVVISDLLNPHLVRVVKGIQSVLGRAGVHMVLFDHDGRREDELSHLRSLRARGIDGLLLSSPHLESEHIVLIRQAGIPAVIVSADVTESDIPSVSINNAEAACEVILHLHRLGHRRIAILRGPMGDLTTSKERMQGCRLAYLSLGLSISEEDVVEGDFTVEGGYEATLGLLDRPHPPTAIFAFSDTMAIGALMAARERGVAVPEALSIVGFDDIPWASVVSPRLTSVAQPAFEIGQTAAELLLGLIGAESADETPQAHKYTLPHQLIERESCGPVSDRPRAGGRAAHDLEED
ncbi:MAG TPA: LacI family DNA-binding transcriptional regulator [Limnochordia bacterium]